MSTKRSFSRLYSFMLIFVLLFASTFFALDVMPAHATGVRYVKPAASGTGDCSSWDNACTLQVALTGAFSGDEIWAATGTYKTSTGTDRTATFQLKDGVAIYGGFAGTETARDQLIPAINASILSGEIGTAGISDNSYHVVTGATGAILDGFLITAGNANGDNPNDRGGGMYNNSSNPTLVNITFSGNSAIFGGGMYNDISSPILDNITFSSNLATSHGGGMYNSSSSPTLTNVTFSDNSAIEWGGGIYNNSSNPTLTNITLNGNSAQSGGGIYNISSTPQIRNTILWGNTATITGTQIYNNSSYPVFSYSVVQGGYAGGTNIITSDPLLGTLGDYGGFTQTIPLLPGSSAVETGNDGSCPSTDQRGIARPQRAHCDIGAYEYDYTGIFFVKSAAIGTADCSNWDNACTLQTALTTTISGDEIWVAAGAYKPTTGTDRTATFQLKDGVALYGGFAGTETARDQRDPASNLTTLSGDLSGDDVGFTNNSENVYHVVTGAHNATLDGFTITAGNANGTTSNELCGGGMYNTTSSNPTITNVTFSGNSSAYFGGGLYVGGMYTESSNPTLVNVTFSGNSAGHSGGGMYTESSNPTLVNVTFSGNSATLRGGGMFALRSSTLTNVTFSENSAGTSGGGMHNYDNNPTLMNVTFSGNSAQHGGGMYNQGSPTLTNVTFSGNSAHYGGGMRNEGGHPTLMNVTFNDNYATLHGGGMNNKGVSMTLTNATFEGNSAVLGGGMYNTTNSNPTITNVTFSDNSADFGGGIGNYINSSPQIQNTILWGNTASFAGAQIYNDDTSSSPVVSYSVVQNGYDAGITNIITSDPRLGTLGNYGGFTQTIPLLEGSSAIDAANDLVSPATDQRGVLRPQGTHCDIGAFEVILYPYSIYLPLVIR